jgi:hypothetical protein
MAQPNQSIGSEDVDKELVMNFLLAFIRVTNSDNWRKMRKVANKKKDY